ncbi:MAG: dTDP-4-dehydrorhamnose 3,5-epimerase [Rhodospirillaceae bacterium]|nr:dTDP-4-dehydrorhamnose 3,5-epimerase [Rhodospirillaceae bacterium]|tara:strand:+ start:11730 stop:12275 length:546 start_codon:yes stop_codon:yes gene_type:complete
MNISFTKIDGPVIIEPDLYKDQRGYFMEAFNLRRFQDIVNLEVDFVQDNQSCSRKGVIRGLHYQIENPQGKLVRVLNGSVFDVFVDIRESSQTFGQWGSVMLSSDNKKQVWIPVGFAHGFMALSESVEVLYKTTGYYDPKYERCIRWDDTYLSINWPENGDAILSDKDIVGVQFKEADFFE